MEQQERNVELLWSTYTNLAGKLPEEHSEITEMLKEIGERLILCSSSLDDRGKGCGPGGFLEITLQITMKMRSLSKALELDIPQQSVLKVGLFHAIGQIGDRTRPYLIENDSEWHRKKGILYKYNEDLPKSLVPHRSLIMLQQFGVKLTPDEWLAIAISGGPHRDENRFYVGAEPPLGILLAQARQWVFGRE